jgi:hypothetical protein
MKKVILNIIAFAGFMIFAIGLYLLKKKFGTVAWIYGIMASFGVLVYTSISYIKDRIKVKEIKDETDQTRSL